VSVTWKKSRQPSIIELAQECDSYSEYRMKAEIYGLQPEDEKTYEANHKGIIYCPYVPLEIMKPCDNEKFTKSLSSKTTYGKADLLPRLDFNDFLNTFSQFRQQTTSNNISGEDD